MKFLENTISDALKPDPDIDLAQYADRYYILPPVSEEAGKYRISRTPYTREILQSISPQSNFRETVFVKPTQIGGTEIMIIFLFGTAYLYPAPAMVAFPNSTLAEKLSKKRIDTAIACNPEIQALFPPKRSRTSGETILFKIFRGGSWTLTGSSSFASQRGESIRFMTIDDFDGIDRLAGLEGDRSDLYRRRCDWYGQRARIYFNSTPTMKDNSPIWWLWERSRMGLYHIPCPICEKFQALEFGDANTRHGIKFRRNKKTGKAEDVHYVCKFCHKKSYEPQWKRESRFSAGKYVFKHPDRERNGFRINGLYSPLGKISWQQFTQDFLEAKDDPIKLQSWENTRNANVFEIKGNSVKWKDLRKITERFSKVELPHGCLLLTLGVDTHDSGLPFSIWGWGHTETNNIEAWLIDSGYCAGDPAAGHCFRQLEQVADQYFRTAYGGMLHISQVAIDIGGHRTEAVKNFVRHSNANKFMAVHGASSPGRPALSPPTLQDVTWEGARIKSGVKLWTLGTEIIKDWFYANMIAGDRSPQIIHFPDDTTDAIFAELCAEKRITTIAKNGRAVSKYVPIRKDNHALDCFVYAYAAAVKVGMLQPDFAWDAIRAALTPTMKNIETVIPKKPKKRVVKSKYLSN